MAGDGNGAMADAPFKKKGIMQLYFLSLDPLFIFAMFTGDRDDIIIF